MSKSDTSKDSPNQTEFEWSEFGDALKEEILEDIDEDAVKIKDPGIADIFTLKNSNGLWDYLEKKSKTQTVKYGLQTGKPQYSQIHTGTGKEKVALDGWQMILVLTDLFKNPAEYTNEFTNENIQLGIGTDKSGAKTGVGKSWTKAVGIEVIRFVRNIPPENVYTNVIDWYEDIPETKDELLELLRNEDEETIVGLDEAAQFLQYADQTYGKEISQAAKMARHNKTHMIFVGHTGKDIPADIRRQCAWIMKHSEQTGSVGFNPVEDESGHMTLQNTLYEFEGMPKPNNPPPQQPDLIIPYPEVEDKEKCYVALDDGTRCPNVASEPHQEPLVCTNHSNKIEEAFKHKINDKWTGADEKLAKLKEKYNVTEEDESEETQEMVVYDEEKDVTKMFE